MSDILNTIITTKHLEIARAKQAIPQEQLIRALEHQTPARGFAQAILNRVLDKKSAVIAEVKKASPSKGVIRDPFLPGDIAQSYEKAGAACLSVLTDTQYFQGCPDFLIQAKNVCKLPVLRKDFIVDEYQVFESRAMGADAILLIAAALTQKQMLDLERIANQLGLDVLVEVHNEAELLAALTLSTPLLGINNRNLKTFEVSLDNTYALLPKIPPSKCVVTESGILSALTVQQMHQHGVYAFLVGEAFMRAPDPGTALRAMFG